MRVLLPAMALLLAACATNTDSLDAAAEVARVLDDYEARLTAKINEQTRYYDRRVAALADARADVSEQRREQRRATRALEAASEMASSPDTSARAGHITRFLLDGASEEAAIDAALRDEARRAEDELRSALQSLRTRQNELRKARRALASLTERRTTRAEALALLAYLESLQKELGRD